MADKIKKDDKKNLKDRFVATGGGVTFTPPKKKPVKK